MPSAEPLFHLAYISRRSTRVLDAEVVDGIVLPAMAKNRRLDITGCLWFGPDRFIQVLEGGERVVRDLFDVIRVDDRHHQVNVLTEEPIAQRSFLRFNMKAIGEDAPESVAQLAREVLDEERVPKNAVGEFQSRVRQAIADLAAWPVGP